MPQATKYQFPHFPVPFQGSFQTVEQVRSYREALVAQYDNEELVLADERSLEPAWMVAMRRVLVLDRVVSQIAWTPEARTALDALGFSREGSYPSLPQLLKR